MVPSVVTAHRVAMDTSLCLDDHFLTPPTLRNQFPTLSVGDEFKSYFSYLIIAHLVEHCIGIDYGHIWIKFFQVFPRYGLYSNEHINLVLYSAVQTNVYHI